MHRDDELFIALDHTKIAFTKIEEITEKLFGRQFARRTSKTERFRSEDEKAPVQLGSAEHYQV